MVMAQPRGTYAARTSVTPEQSMAEIEATLKRYGCQDFARLTSLSRGAESIAWVFGGIGYRVTIERGTADQIRRQRWRATLLAIKALLEWSEIAGAPVGSLLMPFLVLSDGRTVAESGADMQAIAGRGWAALLEGKN